MKKKVAIVRQPLFGAKRADYAILTIGIGLGLNAFLFILKLFVGLSVNSVSILTDSLNSLGDAAGCGIGWFSFAMLKKKASSNLKYGYGRMEYITNFLLSVIILLIGLLFLYMAAERLMMPYPVAFAWTYFGIMLFTVFVKIGMGFFYRFADKKVKSGVLEAMAFDSFLDAGITAMITVGLALGKFSWLRADAVLGITVSLILLIGGIKLLVGSVKTILGKKPDKKTAKRIGEICRSFEGTEMVDLTVHDYGVDNKEIVMEVLFTNEKNFDIIKEVSFKLEEAVLAEFGGEVKICLARTQNGRKEA